MLSETPRSTLALARASRAAEALQDQIETLLREYRPTLPPETITVLGQVLLNIDRARRQLSSVQGTGADHIGLRVSRPY